MKIQAYQFPLLGMYTNSQTNYEMSYSMAQGSYELPSLSEYVVTEINYEHFTAECCAEDDFNVGSN